jgi:hypothetical protein
VGGGVHAIHRMFFNVNPSECAHYAVEKLKEKGRKAKLVFGRWNPATRDGQGGMVVPFRYRDGAGKIIIEDPKHPLAIGELQDIFDGYIGSNPSSSLDYIHGDEAFMELSNGYDCIGFYFEAIKKPEFFDMIVKCGVLPKKTFSLGEAEEKRYYMECRLITPRDPRSRGKTPRSDIYQGDLFSMGVKVAKFGGSSLADAEHISRMRDIIRADGDRRFVVPWAPGKRSADDMKVTDLLYHLYHGMINMEDTTKVFTHIYNRFVKIKKDLGVKTKIEDELEKIYDEVKYFDTPDYAASRGNT